jgi:hypothetical protein
MEGWGETIVGVVRLVGLGGEAMPPDGGEQEVATRTTAPAARTRRGRGLHPRRAAPSCAEDAMANGSNLVDRTGSGVEPIASARLSGVTFEHMFERFTDRARRVVVLAQEEARMLNHNYIGTEHILLGLVREGEGVAAQVLQKLGADLERVRQQIIQLLAGYAGPTLTEPVSLSEEDIDLLEDIAKGASRKKIAEKLRLSRDELNSRIDRALEKLRSRSSAGHIEETHETPRCPRCRRDLAETGAVLTLDLAAQGTDETRAVSFAYCRRCGTWLGTV